MKKHYYIFALLFLGLFACTEDIENIYPPYLQSTELDFSLFPGSGEQDYIDNYWPTFSANTNTDRNILIEDYTGHKCNNCPDAAIIAEDLKNNNPGRVFVSSVHTSPEGMGSFQQVDATYTIDFTCPEGLEIGLYFGYLGWTGSPFWGNPYGTVSRNSASTGFPVQAKDAWTNSTNSLLAANDLKVNIQAETNYFTSTNGLFVHTEIEVLDPTLTNELYTVVQIMEDTLVGPQKMPDNSTNYTYKHHDIMRGCIDGRAFGQKLDAAHLNTNGKYYYDYSYKLPSQYDPDNMHLLIYVRDANTEEIYQVIKKKLQ
ncbi:MAG: hypothetical protein EP333_03625 [Bacteroidetes bacterium]|nr:MAG: hypothetical protein EP333_03625 [Bacteroidota bacterium]TNE97802.1 MAG: hypothetical protein EP322_06040 [Bacteroidota bacterium]